MTKIQANTQNQVAVPFDQLYQELIKSWYEDADRAAALKLATRLDDFLSNPDIANSIRGEETRSIIAEVRSEWSQSIQSREAEIRKILELHARTVSTAAWEVVRRHYDFADVRDRFDLLALLYDKRGEVQRAISVLEESKKYCQSHGVVFESQPFLDELSEIALQKQRGTSLEESIHAATVKMKMDRRKVATDIANASRFLRELGGAYESDSLVLHEMAKVLKRPPKSKATKSQRQSNKSRVKKKSPANS